MTSYLSAFNEFQRSHGILAYPIIKGKETAVLEIERQNPWQYPNLIDRDLSFLTMEINPDNQDNNSFTEEEQDFLVKVRRGLKM